MVSAPPCLIQGGDLDVVLGAGLQTLEGEGGLGGVVMFDEVGACFDDEGVTHGMLHRGPARVDGAVGVGHSDQLWGRHHCRDGGRSRHSSVRGPHFVRECVTVDAFSLFSSLVHGHQVTVKHLKHLNEYVYT